MLTAYVFYTESVQQLINFCLHFRQNGFFKGGWDFGWKFTTAERLHWTFLREFRTRNWTKAQIL